MGNQEHGHDYDGGVTRRRQRYGPSRQVAGPRCWQDLRLGQAYVRAIAAGTINCFCHGSRFRITDGSVAGGPSPAPLTALPVERDGDELRVG